MKRVTQSVRTKYYYDWDSVPVIMDIPMACALLGVGCETLRKMLQNGDLPGFKVGQAWRINRADVMALAGVGGK